jgi:threonine/homoserine/homoserine lactone efflux protein
MSDHMVNGPSRVCVYTYARLVPTLTTFAVFALASLALLLVPGPAVVYIVTRSIAQGRRIGIASVVGVHVGTSVHVAAASVGLSALLVSSVAAFNVVKYAGAAYLIALGLRRLLSPRGESVTGAALKRTTPRGAFTEGIVVNVLNPKTALFFLAFLPQFLDSDRGWIATQALLLGLTFIVLGLLTDSGYALAASVLARRLQRSPRSMRRSERASGLVYIALGCVAASTPRHVTSAA